MINLLPRQHKDELRREETFRLVVILGFLLVLFFMCLSLLLLSIRVYMAGELRAQRILVESQKQEQDESPLQQIRSLNGEIVQIRSFYANQAKLSDTLVDIGQAMPSATYLTSFTYTPSTTAKGQQGALARVSLMGFAPTTEDLLAFRTNLEQNPLFGNFSFPPSNWVTSQNITFSFVFDMYSRPQ